MTFPLNETINIRDASKISITLPICDETHNGLQFKFIKTSSISNIITFITQSTNVIIQAGSVTGTTSNTTILGNGYTSCILKCNITNTGVFGWIELGSAVKYETNNNFTGLNTFTTIQSAQIPTNINDLTNKIFVDNSLSSLSSSITALINSSIATAIQNAIPTGTIMTFMSDIIPAGYLLCNGTTYSVSTYPNLFGVLGLVYGGSYVTLTFRVPDFRGCFLRGLGTNGGSGNYASAVKGILQTDQIASHNHDLTYSFVSRGSSASNTVNGLAQTGLAQTVSTQNQTGGGAETRPANYAVNYIIKY